MPCSLVSVGRLGRHALSLALVATLLLASRPLSAAEITGLQPAEPQALQPGLAVEYWFNLVRSIKEMEYWMQDKGRPGKPLPMLNYQSGVGRVLSTNQPDGVMARIHGFIRFEQPGAYGMWLHTNDGAVLRIGGQTVISDPEWHARGDVLTGPVQVSIATAGWYPLEILYFERKGTSTLELYWAPPGATGDKAHVPAEAFGHEGK